MKKGKLSLEEKEYILKNIKLGTEKISSELNRSQKIINDFLDSIVIEEPIKEKTLKQTLFEKNIGKSGNATIMTESAAQLCDNRKKPGRLDPSCVHIIK